MSIPKIKGIENELSIVTKDRNGYHPAKISHFTQMINLIREYFYLPALSFDESIQAVENIDRLDESELTPRSRMLNFISSSHHNLLPNGARLYIDGHHLEYSTPECLSAKTLVAADRAGEAILNIARKIINESLAEKGEKIIIYKDTTDRAGHSYGCHENYSVSRDAFDRIVNPAMLEVGYLASFLICRQMFTGSGKMGIEFGDGRIEESESIYQISQRADFIKQLLGLHTTEDRAIVNTRDEPLSDAKRFGRLHIIAGDANMSELANYMKVGITSLILKMIEDKFLEGDIIVRDPVLEIKLASRDLTCKKPVLETLAGRKLSLLNLNEEFFQKAKDYFSRVSEALPEEADLIKKWEETISDFQTGNETRLKRRFDWKIKEGIFKDFLESHGFPWGDIGKAQIRQGRKVYKVADQLYLKDLLYHNLDKEEGLYWAYKEDGDIEELVFREEVIDLIKNPPTECRSYLRGKCLSKFFNDIDSVDWDSIIFEKKADSSANNNFSIQRPHSRINMLNPAWGGKDTVGEILDRANNCEDLLEELDKFNNGGGK